MFACRLKSIHPSKNNKYFKEIKIYFTKNLRLLKRETEGNKIMISYGKIILNWKTSSIVNKQNINVAKDYKPILYVSKNLLKNNTF